jgi:hypothetical protein
MTAGADLRAGISIDQVAAREFGKYTQLASLELGLESSEVVGSCESAYSCAYYNTISWRNDTTPLPMENRPRAIFERLFGDAGTSDPDSALGGVLEFLDPRGGAEAVTAPRRAGRSRPARSTSI